MSSSKHAAANQGFVETLKNWAAALAIAAVLAIAPTWSHAFGLTGFVAGAATHAAVREVAHRVGHHAAGEHSGAVPQALPAPGSFAHCEQLFPAGAVLRPERVDAGWQPTALCSSHFAVLYSGLSKTPLVVVERLDRAQMEQALEESRTNEFYADPRLPHGARAELEDFVGSGFDRGHMSPAGDQPDHESMAQSFALSNMVPQDPFNNRKTWAKIESDTRKFVRRSRGNVYVFSGPLFRGQQRTIGRGKVWVPSHLFKLVYDEASGRSWAYVIANTADARVSPPMDYASFVQQTGWQLLPASANRGGR